MRSTCRILEQASELRERRDQLRHPNYQKPQLLATSPNQVWSWDITKLLGPVKWTYFYVYVILDIFSRYVVGWIVAECESTELAKRLMGDPPPSAITNAARFFSTHNPTHKMRCLI